MPTPDESMATVPTLDPDLDPTLAPILAELRAAGLAVFDRPKPEVQTKVEAVCAYKAAIEAPGHCVHH